MERGLTARTFFRIATLLNCLAVSAFAQSGDASLNTLHRLGTPLTETVLRYGDDHTEIVVLTYLNSPYRPYPYAVGLAQVFKFSESDADNGKLSEYVDKLLAPEPNVTEYEIAERLKIDNMHASVDTDALERFMKGLRSIRVSPVWGSGVCVDDCPLYDYWFSDGTDYFHYSIAGRKGDKAKLVRWMFRFRAALPELIKRSSAAKK